MPQGKNSQSVGRIGELSVELELTGRNWLVGNFNSSDGKILYISGEIISKDLDKELKSLGYDVKRIVNYTAKPINNIDEKFIEDLKNNIPDIVYIYSQNSALSFLNLMKIYNLTDIWMNTNLMCMSEKISSVLNNIKWKKIFIFNAGEEEYLLYKI